MRYLPFTSLYDKYPVYHRTDAQAEVFEQSTVFDRLKELSGTIILTTDVGVDLDALETALSQVLPSDQIFNIETLALAPHAYDQRVSPYVTEDRVFGFKTTLSMHDLYIPDLVETVKKMNKRVIYGFGAGLIPSDHLIHVTIKRYEHQRRMRQGMPNFNLDNPQEDVLRKYKRAYFLEWVIQDTFIRSIQDRISYLIEWNDRAHPKMVDYPAFRRHLQGLTQQPFRMVPFFDAGVWGGQWLKELADLNGDVPNYAWCFDGVMEENSIALAINDVVFDVPAQTLIQHYPEEVLGKKVFQQYGYNLPIRFDLLDTMDGQNLSLQVHPNATYIHQTFGMPYTQEESYYILDAKEDAHVYLGLKSDINVTDFQRDLRTSQATQEFNAEAYVNRFPAKKHDHFSIPPGTIHCSGKNILVLEISTAAYIFTFKLWDWGRLGLDGKPRPVNIEHGLKNMDYTMTTDVVASTLINPITRLSPRMEKTGLHPSQSLDSYRITIEDEVTVDLHKTVQMANLVEGTRIEIYDALTQEKMMDIHYAETFVIPASVHRLTFKAPVGPCMLMLAEMR